MMNRDFFYSWHKRVLQKQTQDVDIDAIWAAIEPEVDALNVERKRRRGFIFFISILSIAIISAGFIGLFIPKTQNSTPHIIDSNNTNQTIAKQGIQIDELTSNISKATISLEDIKSPTTKLTTNTLTSQSIISPSLNVKDDDTKENVWKSSGQNSSPKVRVEPLLTTAQDLNLETSLQVPVLRGADQKEEVKIQVKFEEDDLKRQKVYLPNNLPLTSIENLLSDKANDELPSNAIIVRKKADFEFSVGLYSGFAFANRTLVPEENSETETLALLRQESEQSLELWNNGIKAKVKHKSGIHFSIGLQYARLAERFQYDTDYLLMDSTANKIIGYSNNLLGDRSAIIGYSRNDTLFDLEYDFYNYYHFLEIPFSLGYQKQYKNWNFGLRGTYIQNISLTTKGRILDSPYSVTNLKDGSSPFKQNLSGSFEGGFTAGYRLSTHFELGLDAYFRYAPNSITRDDYKIRQQYSWTGLNASINYIF